MAIGKTIERLFVTITGDSTELNQVLKEVDKNLNASLTRVGQFASNVGKQLTTKLSLPLLAIGTLAGRVGLSFEKSFNRVVAISQATSEETDRLRQTILQLGRETPFAAREVADGFTFLAQAGLTVDEQLSAIEGTLKLATIGNLELADAANITTNILSGLGLEVEDLTRVNDVLAKTVISANVDIRELGEAFKFIAPTAARLGISVEEASAAIGILGNAGLKGGIATRAFSSALTGLADPTKDAQKLLNEYSIEIFDASGNFVGLTKLVENLENGFEGLTDQQREAALGTIFGTGAVKQFGAILGAGSEELAEFTRELENAGGTADEVSDIILDGPVRTFAEFKSAIEGVGIAISEVLLPILTPLIEKATELFQKFADLDEGVRRNIVIFAIFAAAVGPVLIIIGKGIAIVQSLSVAFKLLGNQAIFAKIKIDIATLGITALIGVLVFALLSSERFRALLQRLTVTVVNLLKPITKILEPFIVFIEIISGLIDVLVPFIEIVLIPMLLQLQLISVPLQLLGALFSILATIIETVVLPPFNLLIGLLNQGVKLINLISKAISNIPVIGKFIDIGPIEELTGLDFDATVTPDIDSSGLGGLTIPGGTDGSSDLTGFGDNGDTFSPTTTNVFNNTGALNESEIVQLIDDKDNEQKTIFQNS